MIRSIFFALRLCLLPALLCGGGAALAERPAREEVLQAAFESSENFWRRASAEPPLVAVRSRSLFTYALLLCEMDRHPERIGLLLQRAAEMQDRDPDAPHYGNFRWQYHHPGVLDPNAAEFCMRTATLLWLRHAAELPAEHRAKLEELMRPAAAACLRR